jgi:hypothetical protein
MKKKDLTTELAMDAIERWEDVVNEISVYFAGKYFPKDAEMWWVSEEVGSVMFINDYFFNPQDMIDFLRYRYSVSKMFEYYWYALKTTEEGGSPINIKNYKKLIKEK